MLSPSLFELSNPFKIEGLFLVPQVLVYCLNDAFIASILCTTKMGFQFWEHIEVRRKEPYQEKIGDEEGFQIHIQSQQSCQLVTCEQGRCPARAEHRKSVVLPSFLRFPGVATSIRLCNMHRLSCDLLKKINHDHPLTKRLRPSSSLLNEPFCFLGRGEPGCFHCLLCIFDSGSKL